MVCRSGSGLAGRLKFSFRSKCIDGSVRRDSHRMRVVYSATFFAAVAYET